jgi:crossover junction endodeoxyribonuclease RuvC
VTNILNRYQPNEIAIEDVFYAKNPKIALMMGYARGASLVAVANQRMPVATYSAREIKMAVSGYGNASKEQIRRMVFSQIEINTSDIVYDISDAFAVAICHCFRRDKKMNKEKIDSSD